ncbi:MAG: HoxN/HupN/NixA family nickel/cobalt transporter [Thiomonas sp.]|jgi:high-affinity nickel-transport protein|uniref:Nickel/cobalt efflux system n=1 Tax=Thiomonas intermedia (strain K12) TaxID=75379 RepID=D5WZX5_THIK1
MSNETSAVLVHQAQARGVRALRFDRSEWMQLAGYYGVIVVLHIVGCGLYLYYAARYPAMIGLGLTAYLFGLRHAFDADHIAAVDDTVRLLVQERRKPLGVGFFFSLGHSTVVFLLALFTAFMVTAVKTHMPGMQHVGGLIGTGVSGTFLVLIGVLNLMILLDLLKVWSGARRGTHNHHHVDALLAKRGLFNRLFGGRLQRLIKHSWQMYPVGFLFGLGFDTASEIGLLAMTAGAATGNLPVLAVLSLPILFTAGMSAMDTTDGVLMTKAYGWALANPLRRIFYSISTTLLSVLVALVLGTVELLQLLIPAIGWRGRVPDAIVHLDFGDLGYVIVGLFLVAWLSSLGVWELGRRRRATQALAEPALHRHEHAHDNGHRHSHKHFH